MDGFTSLQCVGRSDLHKDEETGAKTTIAKLAGDRRVSWESALRTHEESNQVLPPTDRSGGRLLESRSNRCPGIIRIPP